MRNFHTTIDILVKAYLNNDLEHGKCTKCAVGNIVGGGEWARLFLTVSQASDGAIYQQEQLVAEENQYIGKGFFGLVSCSIVDAPNHVLTEIEHAKKLIETSGYTMEELMQVEFAFESVLLGRTTKPTDEDMFNGLMAVVDVLAEIHGIDLKSKEEAKALFVRN